jgi:type IV pilus assembly protein PilO
VNLNELELDEITEWPLVAQSILVVILVILIQGVGCWFYLMPKNEQLGSLKQQEATLRSSVRIKTNRFTVWPQVQTQLTELHSRYEHLLKQLPLEKELASMLASVNETGLKNNLTFTRIDWGRREEQQYLYRLPLNIELSGDYHDIGKFSQAIAGLSRIINLHTVEWYRVSMESSKLHFKVRAYTYQFKPEGDDAQSH